MNNPNPSSPAAIGALVIAAISSPIFLSILGAAALWFRQWVQVRIGATHTAQAIAITGEAVRAAEQIGRTHGLDGAQKYHEAADRSAAYLNEHGIALGADQLQTLIEGAVTQIKQTANAAPMPGVVATGDSPTISVAPPVLTGPSPEQLIAAIAAAVGALFPPLVAAADPAPAPVAETAPVAPTASVTPVPLTTPTF